VNVVKLINKFTKAGIKLAITEELQLKVSTSTGGMTAELKQLLIENKSLLINYLKEYSISNDSELPAITRSERKSPVPLSFSQRRLWFVDQLNQGSAEYNSLNYFVIDGEINEAGFKKALAQLLDRHEVLRTCFTTVGNDPVQVIREEYSLPLQIVDISSVESNKQEIEIRRLAFEEINQIFDLSSDLMVRTKIIKYSATKSMVFYVTHHIATDGWSSGILRQELMALYKAACDNSQASLPHLPIQYADFAVWQNALIECASFVKQLNYWLTQLDGIPQLHSLPLKHSRLENQTFIGKTNRQTLDEKTLIKLKKLCKQQDITLFMLLHGAFSILVSRFTNEQDVIIGTAIAGRTQQVLEPLIGFFVNDLVLRAQFQQNLSVSEFLQQHKKTILAAYQNQNVPFDMLVERLNPPRSTTHNPLFQIKMDLQNHTGSTQSLQDAEANEGTDELVYKSREDLYLSIREYGSGIKLEWRYNTDLFEPMMIESLMESFQVLLDSVCDDVHQPISRLALLSQQQHDALIELGSRSELPSLNYQHIHHWIEHQVSKTPTQLAVVCGDASITYQTLNEKANCIAHYLVEKGVRSGTLVGICTERSIDMIIGILAILKAGGAYVPLDPVYPRARLTFMLEDCNFDIVLTQQDLMSELHFGDCSLIPLDGDILSVFTQQFSAENLKLKNVQSSGKDLAYAIYTSGSTGSPRAVLVSHENLVASTLARVIAYSEQPTSYILLSSFAFDSSVAGIFWTLTTGGKLVIAEPTDGLDAAVFEKLMSENDASHFLTLPSVYHHILNHNIRVPESVKQVIVAGEPCTKQVVQSHYQHSKWKHIALTNEYGPTEGSVWSCYFNCRKEDTGIIPIGVNAPHVKLYVVDENMQLVPKGGIGELAISGAGVTRGYLNQPELTAQKYQPNPFMSHEKGFLYGTGDLVRWSSSNELEYVGRTDTQVKIRGFRVELLEIENKLMQIDDISACAVNVQQTKSGGQRLVSYVVLKQSLNDTEHVDDSYLAGVELTVDQIRNVLLKSFKKKLQTDLPDYMVPSVFVVLEQMPLGPNGKVDKHALPPPQESDTHNEVYIAPSTQTQKVLCTLWEEILSLENVGIQDNFFLLGGHSLLATRLISSIREQFQVELPLRKLFEFPTISELATEIEELSSKAVNSAIIDRFSANESALSDSQDEIEEGVL